MTTPITLAVIGTPLYRQILAVLATDTDPSQGLLVALGQGVNSLYPNYTTNGPSPDRTLCPTPFVIVTPGGKRATNKAGRDIRIIVEVHDDEDHGETRTPGVVARITYLLSQSGWRPANDVQTTYMSGLIFEEESPPFLPDQRYMTRTTQIILVCQAIDRTSHRGYNA